MALRFVSCVALALVSVTPAWAGIHVVDASGAAGFPTIQAAVDAASDGDVILVRGGSYAGFTVAGKALAIVEDVAPVTITGTIAVTGLAAGKTCVLSGFEVVAETLPSVSAPALTSTGNAGAVRVQSVTLRGGAGACCTGPVFGTGGAGAVVTTSTNVIFSGCTLRGGNGGGWLNGNYEYDGGAGGAGLSTQGSQVAFYDSSATGGQGGAAGTYGGDGGDAWRAQATLAFASRSTFAGGAGGNAWDFIYAAGGDGGDSVDLDANSALRLRTCVLNPGTGGDSFLGSEFDGAPGQSVAGAGSAVFLNEAARVLQGPMIGGSGSTAEFSVFGQPGDRVYLPAAYTTVFRFHGPLGGVWQIPFPPVGLFEPVAVVPASGSLSFTAPLPSLPSGVDVGMAFLQAFVIDERGVGTLGTALNTLIVRCATLVPDCDGNGSFDTCDLLAGVADCSANSVPDACEPDCNANGLPDSCDIAGRTSEDLNHNGVPDECEPADTTWHVDAAAPAGGNGSLASPFRTIGEAFAVAVSGNTVRIADGVYTGPQNKNLVFGGRDLVVRSANGPAACVIDGQGSGRAFVLKNQETAAARIQGLTMRFTASAGSPEFPSTGGAIYVFDADPSIVDCRFENCAAQNGGAILMQSSDARIEGCTFTGNNAAGSRGGAIDILFGQARIVDCTFFENSAAQRGGAVALLPSSPQPIVFTNCRMLANTSSVQGGAVYLSNVGGHPVRFDNCLFAGNGSDIGGALSGPGGVVQLSNVTLVDNHALTRGGAIDRTTTSQTSLVDSILWGNTAPSGAQISLANAGSAAVVSFSDVEGGQAAVASLGPLTWGAGNLDVLPQFVDPDGADDDPLTVFDNDYRLSVSSPCIDAGDVAGVATDLCDLDGDSNTAEPVPFDLDLLPRFQDIVTVPDTGSGPPPIVDLGAYERQP